MTVNNKVGDGVGMQRALVSTVAINCKLLEIRFVAFDGSLGQ